MGQVSEVRDAVMQLFDSKVSDFSRDKYKEVLEETISDLEARLECVKEEMAEEGGNDAI